MNRSTLRLADLLPVGSVGLRTRRLRSGLSALGVAIGIACAVSVLGVTASAQADLLAQLDRLGTNLLTVADGSTPGGVETPMPDTATAMVGGIDGVTDVAATAELRDVHAYRSELIPAAHTSSLAVRATDLNLPATVRASVASGAFLTEATARLPVAVLGADAATRLGHSGRVWVGGHWLTIAGVLQPLPLTPEIDRSVLIGFPAAVALFGYDGHPGRIYVRTDPDRVEAVAAKLARTANPTHSFTVAASRPSDALAARLAVARSGTALFLGIGAVALLVGAIGIANVMVIAVLERRTEIGLRRALGARRRHITAQFLTESVLLGALGGVAGVAIGVTVTAVAAHLRDWATTVPTVALWGGPAVAVVIGAVAGLYPAVRASRLAPADALRTT